MNPKIIYYGTPAFACAGFEALLESGFTIVAAVTAPDRPAGRGLKPQASELKKAAQKHNIPVLQPERLKSVEFLSQLKELGPDLQVIVAFRKLPEAVWSLPRLGTFNLHASLLPAYRGAAPINWAIINGETQTGLTTFFLNNEIDKGNIIAQKTVPILQTDNFQTLHDRMMGLGAELIVQTARAIANQTVTTQAQAEIETSTAPKIFKPDCLIRPERTAQQIYDFIRGLSPYPAAWIEFQGKMLKVYASALSQREQAEYVEGQLFSDGKTFLALKTADASLDLLEVQLEGRNRMGVVEFLRGVKWGAVL